MKVQSYNAFWQRIHKSARERELPLRVMFELTYRCNFYCRHCYVPCRYREKKELKTKEAFSVIDQLSDIGCFYLGFTGGEPFVRKDILDILWYAKRRGFEVIIYTNGFLIDKKIAYELGRLRPNKVDITIPGMSEDVFERITRMPGSHRKVFNAIDLLHKRKVDLGFKSCVLKENEAEIKEIQDFAASLGALHRLDNILSPRLDGSREPYRYRGNLNANYRKSNANPRKCLNDNVSVNSHVISGNLRLFKCGVGITQAAITPQGELKMCLMIDYPRFPVIGPRSAVNGYRRTAKTAHQEPNLQDAWNRLKELVASIKPGENYKCNTCALERYCKWCPAMGWFYRKNFTTCDPESRKQAELLRKLGSVK